MGSDEKRNLFCREFLVQPVYLIIIIIFLTELYPTDIKKKKKTNDLHYNQVVIPYQLFLLIADRISHPSELLSKPLYTFTRRIIL